MTTDPFAAAQVSTSGAATATAVEDPFGLKPSEIKASEYPSLDDLDHRILVIQPTKLEKDLPNNLGKPGDTRDRITADVTVIDVESPKDSKTYEDMYLSQAWIIGQVKGLVATRGMLLGVLRKHRSKLTPEGYNTPDEIDNLIKNWIAGGAKGNKPSFAWKMADPTETEKATAIEWYRSKTA